MMEDTLAMSSNSSALDIQVLNWLYEYSVKNGFDQACRGIEAEFIKRNKMPDVPRSGYLLYLRRLQMLLNKKKWKKSAKLETILMLSTDLLQFKPLQKCKLFYEKIIVLYMTAKLLLVNEHQLEKTAVEEHISQLGWREFKSQCQLEDDFFNETFERVKNAASESIEASTRGSAKNTKCLKKPLLLQANSYVNGSLPELLAKLLQLLPPTALEKITNDEDIQNDLARQDALEYKILLNCIKDSLTGNAIRDAVKKLSVAKEELSDVNPQPDEKDLCSPSSPEELDSQIDVSDITIHEDLDIIQVNGKLWTVKRCASVPVDVKNLSCVGSLSEDSTQEDIADDMELQEASYLRHENEIIVHNGKVWEVKPSRVMPVNSQNILIDDSEYGSQMEDPRITEAGYEDSEIRELEELIRTMEKYVAKLKYKLKIMKDRRGAQRYRPQTPDDGDQGNFEPKARGGSVMERQPIQQRSPNNDGRSSNFGNVEGKQCSVGTSSEDCETLRLSDSMASSAVNQQNQNLQKIREMLSEKLTDKMTTKSRCKTLCNEAKQSRNDINLASQFNCTLKSEVLTYVSSSSQEDNGEDDFGSLQHFQKSITSVNVVPETPELSERHSSKEDPHTFLEKPEWKKTNKENLKPKTKEKYCRHDCNLDTDEGTDSDTTYYTLCDQSASINPEMGDKMKISTLKGRNNSVMLAKNIKQEISAFSSKEEILQKKDKYKRKLVNIAKEVEDLTDSDDLASRVKRSPRRCSTKSPKKDTKININSSTEQGTTSYNDKKRKLQKDFLEKISEIEERDKVTDVSEDSTLLEEEDVFHTPMNSPEPEPKRARICNEMDFFPVADVTATTSTAQSFIGYMFFRITQHIIHQFRTAKLPWSSSTG
ncbi:uncharacterized protein LOC122245944 isoform X2 [Penaeus japonicus]|uniref:uncharacterized protein LOC122245944 isoform X2 n=1 Tax=Penaeus japonicus TaxID=27405 RepID=UPI001C714292|nr:uncharacterized protein LOC122245944 isoform X2 [Penaeus japonicus]